MKPRFDRHNAERNVRALQDRRRQALATAGQAVPDLSPQAIKARLEAEGEGTNATGRQLIFRAARVFKQAEKLTQLALSRPPASRRARRLHDQADDALRTAAVQIRIAAATPLERGYLHAMPINKLQDVEEEVARAFAHDPAALAVDTHRRIKQQRLRAAEQEG